MLRTCEVNTFHIQNRIVAVMRQNDYGTIVQQKQCTHPRHDDRDRVEREHELVRREQPRHCHCEVLCGGGCEYCTARSCEWRL